MNDSDPELLDILRGILEELRGIREAAKGIQTEIYDGFAAFFSGNTEVIFEFFNKMKEIGEDIAAQVDGVRDAIDSIDFDSGTSS